MDLPGLLAKLDAASDELTENDEDEVADAIRQTAAPLPVAAPPIPPPAEPAVVTVPMGASAPQHRRRPWARSALAVAAGAALALAWWGRGPTATPDLDAGAASVLATATQSEPDPDVAAGHAAQVGHEQAVAPATVSSVPPTNTMREALNEVAEQLRGCARLAGGVLILELVAEGQQFTKVAIQGAEDRRVTSCVTDITSPLRFAPTPRQALTEEYMP